MTDTATIDRAPQLERHSEFEGVGAHELNPRFENVDGYHGYDEALNEMGGATLKQIAAHALTLITPAKIRLDGIDVSHWQYDKGDIDWPTVAGLPTFWCGFKATQSTGYVDPTFARARASTAAAGLRHRLPYHWQSSTTDPEKQAAWFLKVVGNALVIHEGAMNDAEEAGVTVASVVAWCEVVEAVTRRPCAVYTGAFVAGGTIWTSPLVRMSRYGPRPMILAAYTTEAKALALPGVQANPWSSWQFSSNWPVAGVTGRCDMNRVDDRAAYDLACGVTTTEPANPTPPPIPPESPTQETNAMSLGTISNEEQLYQDFGDGNGAGPWQPGQAKWALIHDGEKITKLHLTGATYVPGGPEAMKSLELRNQIPDYAGWRGAGTVTVPALTVTSTITTA